MSSDRIDLLDAAAEVFYRRLMSKVDDHGLYDARPSILRSSLYPLRVDRVREADITRWIAACEKAGLIALYAHQGKPYLQMLDTRWQARSEPKFPLPPTENGCKQPETVVPVFGDVVVDEDDKRRKRPPTPDGVSDSVWEDFLKLRKAKRAPMTDTALAGIQREADKIGWPLQKALETCCKRGWQGFEADWVAAGKDSGITVASTPGRDPALAKLDQDAQAAKPMSPEQKAALAELKKRITVPMAAHRQGAH